MPRVSEEGEAKIDAPVVVRPETVSNTASANGVPVKRYGSAPNRDSAIQHSATHTKPSRV